MYQLTCSEPTARTLQRWAASGFIVNAQRIVPLLPCGLFPLVKAADLAWKTLALRPDYFLEQTISYNGIDFFQSLQKDHPHLIGFGISLRYYALGLS